MNVIKAFFSKDFSDLLQSIFFHHVNLRIIERITQVAGFIGSRLLIYLAILRNFNDEKLKGHTRCGVEW